MVSRLLIEYDGTDFSGWAAQPGLRTVQAELERALCIALRAERVTLTVAGRTDAGVHARGQVASYEGPPARVPTLNALLPYDVAVLECVPAPPGFNARLDATSRAYRYRLLTRSPRSPFDRGRALHWPHPLDLEALRACAEAVRGTHDFTAFTPTQTEHVRFSRDVLWADWQRSDGGRARVRDRGRRVHAQHDPRARRDRCSRWRVDGAHQSDSLSCWTAARATKPGVTAPPHGLELVGVGYGGGRVLDARGSGKTETSTHIHTRSKAI